MFSSASHFPAREAMEMSGVSDGSELCTSDGSSRELSGAEGSAELSGFETGSAELWTSDGSGAELSSVGAETN